VRECVSIAAGGLSSGARERVRGRRPTLLFIIEAMGEPS